MKAWQDSWVSRYGGYTFKPSVPIVETDGRLGVDTRDGFLPFPDGLLNPAFYEDMPERAR